MRMLRLAGILLAAATAMMMGEPALAGASTPTVDLSVGWGTADPSGGGTAATGSWVPFSATVTVPAGRDGWAGTLVIRPAAVGRAENLGASTYQQPLTVRAGATANVVIYGAYQGDAGAGFSYEALLRDGAGATVAKSAPAALRDRFVTIGVLSDIPGAASLMRGVTYRGATQIRVHLFDHVDGLPSNPLALSGFHAIVIDDFDSSTLSQGQLKALQDYVGFGGSLVITGGPEWRRTLTQLPGVLVPLRPDATGSAALDAVLELIGRSSDLRVPVATGTLAGGARVVLADAAGTPLVVESAYGQGRVVELTYDPVLDPLAGTAMATQTWIQAVDRAVSETRVNRVGFGTLPLPIGLVTTGSGSGGGSAISVPGAPANPLAPYTYRAGYEAQILDVLGHSAAGALPPLALLGALLVAYVLLAGPANYFFVRRRRRRELTWITAPLIAVLFTGIAYGTGIVYRGSDFVVNEIQMLRLGPGEAVDATTLDALFSPRRGNFEVQLPDGSLAATGGLAGLKAGIPAGSTDRVNPGRHPTVTLNDLVPAGERTLRVESVVHTGIDLEAHLGIASRRIVGTVTNRGNQTVEHLALMTVSGEWAVLAGSLGPGATVRVDSPLGAIPDHGTAPCTGVGFDTRGGAVACPLQLCAASTTNACQAPSCPPSSKGICQQPSSGVKSDPGFRISDTARRNLAMVATGASVMDRTDLQALVGTVHPLPSLTVQDRPPSLSSIAAFATPVLLESIDNLPAGWAQQRLVAGLDTPGILGNSLKVWDLGLPARVGGDLELRFGNPSGPAGKVGSTPTRFEVYDWTGHQWTRLNYDTRCQSGRTYCAAITPPMRANGMVRVRTRDNGVQGVQFQLVSVGAPA